MNVTDHQWDEISGNHISDQKGGCNFHVTCKYESKNYTESQSKSVRSRVRETIKVIFLRDGLNKCTFPGAGRKTFRRTTMAKEAS